MQIADSQGLRLKIQYKYDSFGRRIQRSVEFPRQPERNYFRGFVYDGEDIILEYDQNNTPVAFYFHGPGIDYPLGMIRKEKDEYKTYYFTHDHLNSVNSIINEDLKVVQRYNYSVYGETRISDSDGNRLNKFVENPYAYTSREYEVETGDYFYRARYYNPQTGRFLSEDPIHFDGGDLNLFRYIGNNPVNERDPEGEFGAPTAVFCADYFKNCPKTALKCVTSYGFLIDADEAVEIEAMCQNEKNSSSSSNQLGQGDQGSVCL